jgi:phosphoglycerate dehydrogenase-like enzyme
VKILFCGEEFPAAPPILARVLSDHEVATCSALAVAEHGRAAEVLIPLMARLDAAFLATASAKLIQQWGAGVEGVDRDAATARGIPVCNVPSDATSNAEATAEHAIFLMMGLARRFHECTESFRNGQWGAPLGMALRGQRALIVGLGRVGRALASRLAALGMVVEAIRAHPEREDGERPLVWRVAGPDRIAELAATADFLISTVPLNTQSRGLVSAGVLRVMKPTAFVVNVSRGAVVDERALGDALRSGAIAGAGLDVFETEPITAEYPLLSMPNVFATPHVAGVTTQNYEGIARVIADNVALIDDGKAPRYCLNGVALFGAARSLAT